MSDDLSDLIKNFSNSNIDMNKVNDLLIILDKAPRKYNLEQLLTQKPDVFEKSIPKKFLSKATDSQKKAHKLLVEARKSILEASKTNTGEAKLAELIRAPKFENAYKAIKSFLPKARVQTAIVLGVVGGFIGALSKIIFFGDKNS